MAGAGSALMAHYLLTGATGFLGTALVPALLEEGHTCTLLTRRVAQLQPDMPDSVTLISDFEKLADNVEYDGIINLAGEGIADQRWSSARKKVLMDSRIRTTEALQKLVRRLEHKPPVIISGSAVGYYGAQGETTLDEQSRPSAEFTHDLCAAWENAASALASACGARLCIIRLGVVLGHGGGIIERLLLPFRFGLGGRIGSGRQIMSWVHHRDVVRGIAFLLDNHACQGTYNLTAPLPVSNAEFTRSFSAALKRPAVFPIPAIVIKMVFGEMGERLLLEGQKVIPLQFNRAGFIFDFEHIDEAMRDIFPT